MQEPRTIIEQFAIYGDYVSHKAFGNGHINNTYVSTFCQAGTHIRYTHQRINKNVFKNPDHVMYNIVSVTEHVRKKLIQSGEKTPSTHTLTVINTKDAKPYYIDEQGDYWRTYLFVENVRAFEVMENTDLAYKVGKAVGLFQNQLSDYKGQRLYDTIPNFHNMHWRYEQFDQALKNDCKNRAAHIKDEIDFVQKNRERGMILIDGLKNGMLREGITHNDTKLNNILFDEKSGDAVCVIDLDTVMPGTVLFDTGDLIRTATITGAEDEQDISKIAFNFELFKPLVQGYLSQAQSFLSKPEKELIAESGRNITHIMAVRFLTDYLAGDTYYKIAYPEHNLVRFRTQRALIQSMDLQWEQIQRFIKECE